MKLKSLNKRILQGQYLLEQSDKNEFKMKKTLKRISEMNVSMFLARDFNETIDNFLNRKPELNEFNEWSKTICLTNNYELIIY